MQLVNEVQFLDITFLLALFTPGLVAVVFGIVIVPITYIYASLLSHKLEHIIEVLHVPQDSSFISAQFIIMNLDG